MSVQLVVYPQINLDGVYTYSVTANTNEYCADPGLNGSTSTSVSTTASNPPIVGIQTTTPVPNWGRYHSTGGTYGASVLQPSFSGGLLNLFGSNSAGNPASQGVYQRIIGLTSGVDYDLTIVVDSVTSGASGDLFIGNMYGTQINVGGTGLDHLGGNLFIEYNITAGTYTYTFTANATQALLLLEYRDDTGGRTLVDSISIKETQNAANSVYEDFFDGQVILDLYEDTSIPLTLNVDNFKNASEKTTSYSKAFKLPATKKNNKVFSSLYDVTRSTADDLYSFNPYKHTRIRLKEDGYTIFDGKLRLLDITETDGEMSYNVNLYSEAIALKTLLENKKLGDIDFSELKHVYNKNNIVSSWTTGIELSTPLSSGYVGYAGAPGATHSQVLRYPLCDWTGSFTRKYLIGIIPLGWKMNLLEDGFRPWIEIRYLLKRIFFEAGFSYVSTFLDSDWLDNLFIDFNTGKTIGGNLEVEIEDDPGVAANDNWTSTYTGYTPLKFTDANSDALKSVYWTSDTTFTATANNQSVYIEYDLRLENNASGSENIRLRLRNVTQGTNITFHQINISGNDDENVNNSVTTTLQSGDQVRLEFVSQNNSSDVTQYSSGHTDSISFSVRDDEMTDSILSNCPRGNMSQWDFVSGILKAFNLVVVNNSDESGEFKIETYKDVFKPYTASNDIEILDWTHKVDAQEFKLKPVSNKKITKLTYKKDSKDHVSKLYTEATYNIITGEYLFGSYEYENTTDDFATGETKIELPFAPLINKPIWQPMQFDCPAIFTEKGDNEYQDFDNIARIGYYNGTKTSNLGGFGFYSPAQNHASAKFTDQKTYGFISHYEQAGDQNYNFGYCQHLGSQPPPFNTLFSEFWSQYIYELNSPEARIITLKINLYPTDVHNFKFENNIRIKNRLYRVNKIDYKPGDMSSVELLLL